MRSPVRTFIVLVIAAVLVAAFLHNVDLGGVVREIRRARPAWLALAAALMVVNLAIRAFRWQYLLDPLAHVRFASAFRATAVGFAASALLPARAGEVIRPYFLAREEPVSATAAFATVILERLLDVVMVIVLLASFVFVFGRDVMSARPAVLTAVTWGGASAAAAAAGALTVSFMVAGHPARLARAVGHLEAIAPAPLAALVARLSEKFAIGLGAIRRPGRLFGALAWSLPLWLSIAAGVWAVAVAFGLPIPFTGSFLLLALLTIGVAVPTPGAVGGFDEAFRVGATTFFGAPDATAVGAALVLHVLSIAPALLLGAYFAAQAGLNLSAMRQLAQTTEDAA